MEFMNFSQKIKPIIGGSYSTHVFTRTLFEAIITEDGVLQIEDVSENTFNAYYNGQTKITKIPPVFCLTLIQSSSSHT